MARTGFLGQFSAESCNRARNLIGCNRSPQSSRPAESPSGAGVAGAVQGIASGVRSAHQVRFRVIGSAAEQEGQEVDRIGDIDGSIIVVIAGIEASDGTAA